MAGAGRFRRRWADGPWLTGGYRRRMWPGPQGAASGGVVQRQQLGLGLGPLRAQRGLGGAPLRGISAAIGIHRRVGEQIGRASWREKVGPYVWILVVGGSLKKKTNELITIPRTRNHIHKQ